MSSSRLRLGIALLLTTVLLVVNTVTVLSGHAGQIYAWI